MGFVGRVTKGGAPQAGRTILLTSQQSSTDEPEVARATTNADGVYVLVVPPVFERPSPLYPPSFAVMYGRKSSALYGDDVDPPVAGAPDEFRAFATSQHQVEDLPNHQEQVDFDLAWDAANVPIAEGAVVKGPKVDFSFPRVHFASMGLMVFQGDVRGVGKRVCDPEQGTSAARWTPHCDGEPDGIGLPPGGYSYHLRYFDYDDHPAKNEWFTYSTPWLVFTVN